jgi:hypothetical protein
MASHRMARERVAREISLSLAAHRGIAWDWHEARHVYIQHPCCRECEGDPWYKQKDWRPGHNPDVVTELLRQFALNSGKV